MTELDPETCQICQGKITDHRSEQWFNEKGAWIGWAHSDCVDAKELRSSSR